ncbi:hypothetical protein [Maritimibacter fusiformis]|uniref:Lipoprotein n=1 Tax=Maritimibacter fusiformis TaxID=2603819 RepID=A0A5D0REG5_9RHOB|nr:hypothetical protein [Maritimibacter fusiformis]TYB80080.1 hypothetical protein FVF75_14715 [Maritimibacter fusiformis]
MIRIAKFASLFAGAVLALSACAVTDLEDTPQEMGRFLLGFNIVTVNDAEVGPMSRAVDEDLWVGVMRNAINERFSRYDGDQYYHISVAVLGYVLAQPGIPIVASPKSVLIADVRVYDDATGELMTGEAKQITVFEEGGDVLVGSGLTRTAEEQMASLARNMSKSIHDWMLENVEFFGDASLMDPETTSPGRPVQPLAAMPGSAEALAAAES